MAATSELVLEEAAVTASVTVVKAFGAAEVEPSLMVVDAVGVLLAATTVKEEVVMVGVGVVVMALTAVAATMDVSLVAAAEAKGAVVDVVVERTVVTLLFL